MSFIGAREKGAVTLGSESPRNLAWLEVHAKITTSRSILQILFTISYCISLLSSSHILNTGF